MEGYRYAIWHPPVTLRLVFSLGVGMKGYLYTRYPSIPTAKENPNLRVTGGYQYSIEVYLHSYT
jgi:hypothetical protein